MFAEQDVRDVFSLVPPEYPPHFRDKGILPYILFSSRGDGLLTEKSVVRAFEHLTRNELKRLSLENVAKKLDVDTHATLQLVRASSQLALLTEDELAVIASKERSSIALRLEELVTAQLVSRSAFSRENDISRESFYALVHTQKDSVKLLEANEFVLGGTYEQALSETVKERLERSLQGLEPVELSPSSLPGLPPTWCIEHILKDVLDRYNMGSQFHIGGKVGSIRCVPRESAVRKRDAIVAQLQSGDVPYVDMRIFAEDFKEIFSSLKEANDHIESLPLIYLSGAFAISQKWLSTVGQAGIQDLADKGIFDCIAQLPPDLPSAVQEEIVEKVFIHVNSAHAPSLSPLHRIGGLVLTESQYGSECDTVFDLAKTYAVDQWKASNTSLEKGLKFQMSSILGAISLERSILRAVAQEKRVEGLAADTFWNRISESELKNEAEFSAFWAKRVTSRVQTYCEGLTSIEDTKLHDQLADLLSIYLQKELIPDSLTKARSQEIICSRKTQKNIQKLEAVLKASKQDFASVTSSIEKFNKKQGVQDVEALSLTETKSTLVGDMIRRMQKPKTDGPLLFLTLVIVLFARHYPGVVYATGKFAPKLLKQLKINLSTEKYDQIESWKELAKSGTLTSEDQKAMLQEVQQE